ncbi:MAG: hypothetical protein GAK30_01552 [Paracidovorax wautersii]|uniref:Lcl C-terminal domain-containing protein n=1 Tax=Paracidovorax wautersii TaxID=1177982 RepID=A0A7V8JQW4_9BURK|nr:MAG: hypothetical protein GAK30_01552 [Paracidovorax wautersii]
MQDQVQTQDPSIPLIGQPWTAQGGILGAIVQGDGESNAAIIVPTAAEAFAKALTFGAYGKYVDGADSYTDGKANTAALIASGLDFPAAQHCANLVIDGLNDWYLPSIDQLRALRINVPDLFKVTDWYWSSTQSSPLTAWAQDFKGGYSGRITKDTTCHVRPVRSFLIR